MATNSVTDVTITTYVRRPTPNLDESFRLYIGQEFQAIENAINSIIQGTIQVADNAPEKPKKGMVRYALTPWDPLGTGYTGLVVYDGTTWMSFFPQSYDDLSVAGETTFPADYTPPDP